MLVSFAAYGRQELYGFQQSGHGHGKQMAGASSLSMGNQYQVSCGLDISCLAAQGETERSHMDEASRQAKRLQKEKQRLEPFGWDK